MTDSLNVFITDSTGATEISLLSFAGLIAGSATDAISIRIYNAESSAIATNALAATRIDMRAQTLAGEEAAQARANGLELVDETWLEARLLPTDAWTPVDSWTNKLTLGSIAAGSYVAAQIRVNVPAGASTFGPMAFCVAIHSRL